MSIVSNWTHAFQVGGPPAMLRSPSPEATVSDPQDSVALSAEAQQETHLESHRILASRGGYVGRFPPRGPVAQEALRHLGLPYRYGGSDLQRGVDCSGFTYAVYARVLKSQGRAPVPLSWFRDDGVDPRKNPRHFETHGFKHTTKPAPGDVVTFGTQHVGIYLGTVDGVPLYVSANHGGKHRPGGRVDIMRVSSVGIPPVYFHQFQ